MDTCAAIAEERASNLGTTAALALASGRAARADSLTGPGRPALHAWLHR